MKLATREVFQIANRCLASAGLPRGLSKETAKSIWWTEVYRGRGFATLHRLVEEAAPLDSTALSLEDRTSTFSIVDSGGQPSILSSTTALDFSCAQAAQEGIGITYSSLPESDCSLPALGHTVYSAANRGLVSVVLCEHYDRSECFIGVPSGSHPTVAEIELDGLSSSYRKLLDIVDNGLYRQRHSPLVQAFLEDHLADSRSATDAATLGRLLEGTTDVIPEETADEYGFFTVCIDPGHPRNSSEIRRTADQFLAEQEDVLTAVHHPSDVGDRGRTLIEKGVDVDRQVWEELFEYSNGIFAPDSLGAETGAGPSLEG